MVPTLHSHPQQIRQNTKLSRWTSASVKLPAHVCACVCVWLGGRQKDHVCVSECGCVLMDRQMGGSTGTVDEGFTLQLARSAARAHTRRWRKEVGWRPACVCVCAAAALASGGQQPHPTRRRRICSDMQTCVTSCRGHKRVNSSL